MAWVPRGLREGIVTTPYPRRPDGYGPGFRATVAVSDVDATESTDVLVVCPTRAIAEVGGRLQLDRGRCILCGRCVDEAPTIFRFTEDFELSTVRRQTLVVPTPLEEDAAIEEARVALGSRVRALRRSVHIRHVDAGSDGSDEWEVAALTNPIYDIQRLGVFFTASPRHADILLVTGIGSVGMAEPLRRTYEAMPHPKVVIAAGVDAISAGVFSDSYASHGGISDVVDVDVFVPGSPATPFGLLHGILTAVDLVSRYQRVPGSRR